jgi:hypothetical protein
MMQTNKTRSSVENQGTFFASWYIESVGILFWMWWNIEGDGGRSIRILMDEVFEVLSIFCLSNKFATLLLYELVKFRRNSEVQGFESFTT